MDFTERLNEKWRNKLFEIGLVYASISVICEVLIYLYDSSNSTLFLPLPIYQLRFIYIPAGINYSAVILTYFYLKSNKFSSSAKNNCASLLISLLCANVQITHYVYSPLLVLPTIAIFLSVLFSNKCLTRLIGAASLVTLAISYRIASVELRKDDPYLRIDTILAAVVLIASYFAATLLIQYVSEQIRYIMASNERQRKLIEACNIDPLVGIGNRRALSSKLEKVVRSVKKDKKYYLLMTDIDDFKKVNDTFGHQSGDEVLLSFGALIRRVAVGKPVTGYRFGGEEFVLVFEGVESEELCAVSEDLRSSFETLHYSFQPKEKITISGGVSQLQPGMDAQCWLKSADQVLYLAKASGKNKIYISRNWGETEEMDEL